MASTSSPGSISSSRMHYTLLPKDTRVLNPCTVPSPPHSSPLFVVFSYPEMPSLTFSELAPKTQKA